MSGKLFVVATPLGNLDDLSPRAVETLRAARYVACEDTRRTSRLLARHAIDTPRVSCHRFNERERLEEILDHLRDGSDIALVSDAGTPGISDPGSLLVSAALEAHLPVSPIPGPSAVATLLSASGLPADRFVFDGFLPHRAGERRRRLRELRDEVRTLVLFETPHRILAALDDIGEVLGPRRVVLGRELTKVHETLLAGTPAELRQRLSTPVRGEVTLAIAGADSQAAGGDREADRILERWEETLERLAGNRRAALRQLASELGLGRDELQRRLTELGR